MYVLPFHCFTPLFTCNAQCIADGDSHNETTLTEAVPPNETSGSSLARRTAIPFKGPPKLDVSRDKVVIELDVDDSASEPATCIKPQVDLCQENA